MLKKHWKEIVIGLVTGVLNGLFGAGGGSVVVPAMEKFLGIDEKQSHATAILVIFMMSIVSAVVYVRKGFFDLRLWAWVTAGGVVGGLVGAKLLKKIPKKWLKIGFGGVIIVTAVKMIF
ncbi:MAG: sulfite exporter TauE/SafE family protein [Ruminococcaceae bacterium]|nr:sulfite exporter TauE/SafE family protein [Oscillospiraceae bacterium]